ncbi:hypothetical protein F5X96DRAFT_677677 [Biscogniauxia mediterranea]|nr:hypothetical protein F5X96DRAFT_677677 [Biscogniauxia mediterranea]
MSVVYETRSYLPSDPYPPNLGASDHGDDGDAASSRYSPNSMQDLVHFNQLRDDPTLVPPSPESPHHLHHLLAPPTPPEGLGSLHNHNRLESEGPAPPRIKPISKPDRVVLKNIDGKYCCTWPNCTDEVREFNRKCEWSKHMDKHDRPYKCPAGGCEKLPGFTYSGGLLRHEREVHGKHGGPKNPLNCPHVNCKRHTGKGFSRLENLNEHLRRVHTADIPTSNNTEEADDVATLPTSPKIGEKRKPDDDLREEVKRLQGENQELRSQVEAQKRQQIAMMQLMQELQESLQNISGHPERIPQPRFESGSPPAAPAAPAPAADNGAPQVSQSF